VPGGPQRNVIDVIQRGSDAGKEPGTEPEERWRGIERELAAISGDPAQQTLDDAEGIAVRQRRRVREKSVKQVRRIGLWAVSDRLGKMS
jgi:hypothetical protein